MWSASAMAALVLFDDDEGDATKKQLSWLSEVLIEHRPVKDAIRPFVSSKSASTQQAYVVAIERWIAWVRLHEIDPNATLTDQALARYVEHCRRGSWRVTVAGRKGSQVEKSYRPLSIASIKQAMAAIQGVARAGGLTVEQGPRTGAALERAETEAARTARGKRTPLSPEQAEKMIRAAEAEGAPIGLRDAALLSVLSGRQLALAEAVRLDWSKISESVEGLGSAELRRLERWRASSGRPRTGPVFRPIRRGGHVQDRHLSLRAARTIISTRAAQAASESSTLSERA